jgi:ribonuclease P protein component
MGVGAGKKHFKTAVKRNRIKRMTREAFRVQKEPLMDLLYKRHRSLGVFLVYTGSTLVDFSTIQTSMSKIIGKLLLYTDEQI